MRIKSPYIKDLRGKGLLIGVEFHPEAGGAPQLWEVLKEKGLHRQETHQGMIRFALPLIMRKGDRLGS